MGEGRPSPPGAGSGTAEPLLSAAMSATLDRAYLSFLARWDREERWLTDHLSGLAGHPVRFATRPPPGDAAALFQLFARDPLDAVTLEGDGAWSLSYDPLSAYQSATAERYLRPAGPPLHARVPLPYHAVPGALRLALYPFVAGLAGRGAEATAPDWPIEARIDTFRAALFRGARDEGRRTPSKTGGPWHGGARCPLLFTLDVDTKEGQRCAGQMLDELLRWGVRPCVFLVGRGYRWDEGLISAVRQAGGEIGLHGDVHDNRLSYLDAQRIGQRLDSCRELVERHQVRGFRSPSLLVSDALYAALKTRFRWDSSVPDTDRDTLIGPRRGCGTTFPFHRAGTLVLPVTMPADDRLELLGIRGLDATELLRRKWLHLREVCGLVHFLVHPEPHLFGQRARRELFGAVVQEIVESGEQWVATPSEVATMWRRVGQGTE